MAELTIPININLPEDWLEQIIERIKQDDDWVLVVRCKDCDLYGKTGCPLSVFNGLPKLYDYCSYGKIRGDD